MKGEIVMKVKNVPDEPKKKEEIEIPIDNEETQPIVKKKVPRKKSTLKKKPAKVISGMDDDIKKLLTAASTIASIYINPIWLVSEDELEMISKPLANILQRMNINSDSKYIDFISLSAGLGIIIIPRAMQQIQINKLSLKEVKPDERKDNRDDSGIDTNTTDSTAKPFENLYPNI
jgi:hypothetical protein